MEKMIASCYNNIDITGISIKKEILRMRNILLKSLSIFKISNKQRISFVNDAFGIFIIRRSL